MIFTTHGDFVARTIPTRDFDYGLELGNRLTGLVLVIRRLVTDLRDYPGEKDYGVS